MAHLITPTFTARTVIIPPQQQSGAAAALGSLGTLAGLATGAPGLKNPLDQYVSLMQSETVLNRLVSAFDLNTVYDEKYKVDVRKKLLSRTAIAAGKKDGLITVDVEDESPARAAQLANGYVEALKEVLSKLAVTEAQQRRVFFEQKLRDTKEALGVAQQKLQDSGFGGGALKTEPKAAAEEYVRLRSEIVSAEVRYQAMSGQLASGSPELLRQQSFLSALRAQMKKIEDQTGPQQGMAPDYVGRYRDFKYYESLFEMYAKQFELARVDESREGALIQIVDIATQPEKRSKPKRLTIAVGALVIGGLLAFLTVMYRNPSAAKKS